MSTKIAWTNKTWNPVTGCTPVSEGCAHCYAARMAKRWAGRFGYPKDYPFKVTVHRDKLSTPLKWKKPRRIFVCSMGDLFHKDVTLLVQLHILKVMKQTPQHQYQVLTKRPEIAKSFLEQRPTIPSNLWLGVSAENQKRADERIPILLEIPTSVRFVSLEPLLGSVDVFDYWSPIRATSGVLEYQGLNWVIIGCESGPGRRECKIEWVRDIVEQCQEADIAAFVKQLSINGRVSHDPAEWPEDLRIQEYPDS